MQLESLCDFVNYLHSRILTKRLVPDKQWLRLSHCLLLILDNKDSTRSSTERRNIIDMNSWYDLKRILTVAVKSTAAMAALKTQLLAVPSKECSDILTSIFHDKTIEIVMPVNKQSNAKVDDGEHFMSPTNTIVDDR